MAFILPKYYDCYKTPSEIYDKLNSEFFFDLDPCPFNANFDISKDVDGLKISWLNSVFVNPPYSDIYSWLVKGFFELDSHNSNIIVYLLPVWTDSFWFHDLLYKNRKYFIEIRYLRGLLSFGGAFKDMSKCNFPSMIVIIRRLF